MIRSWTDHGTRRTGQLVVTASLLCTLVSPAAADILHDQRIVTLSGLWDTVAVSYIGGQAYYPGSPRDQQQVDDFTLTARANVTRVTVDSCSILSSGPGAFPADGFLIEIFPTVGSMPSEVPVFSATSTSYTHLIGSFPPAANGNPPEAHRHTFVIDIPEGGVELDTGTWWLAVQAVDLTPIGDRWSLPLRRYTAETQHLQFGGTVYNRAAGIDHGNGFPTGGGAGSSDWAQSLLSPYVGQDASFSLEGVIVPGPGSVAAIGMLLGIGAATRGRRRPER